MKNFTQQTVHQNKVLIKLRIFLNKIKFSSKDDNRTKEVSTKCGQKQSFLEQIHRTDVEMLIPGWYIKAKTTNI